MKNLFSLIACCVLVLVLMPSAYGAEEPYVSPTEQYMKVSIGLAMKDDSEISINQGGDFDIQFKQGPAFSLAGGSSLGRLRQEAELAYQYADLEKAMAPGGIMADLEGEAWSLSLLANGYFDLINSTPLTPYVSLGIGLAYVEVSDVSSPDGTYYLKRGSDVVFAYQGGAGFEWRMFEAVSLDLAYRYFATLDLDLDKADMDFSSHNVYFGVRVYK